jgi:Flp pilus assembly pilin Flp
MLNHLRAQMARLREEDGQTLIEYALLAFLVAIAAIVLLAAIGFDLQETFDAVEEALGLDDGEAPAVPTGDEDAEPAA